MEFDSVIKKRTSVNSFKDKKPSWKAVLEAIDFANQAPFAGNNNNLKFIIIENEETINKIAKHTEQLWINKVKILVVICSNIKIVEKLYHERGKIYAKQQAGAAIENLLLKITDLNLSACWVGAFKDLMIKRILKIPKDTEVEAIIPIGYEETKTQKKRKMDLENTIFWEHWGTSRRPPLAQDRNLESL